MLSYFPGDVSVKYCVYIQERLLSPGLMVINVVCIINAKLQRKGVQMKGEKKYATDKGAQRWRHITQFSFVTCIGQGCPKNMNIEEQVTIFVGSCSIFMSSRSNKDAQDCL